MPEAENCKLDTLKVYLLERFRRLDPNKRLIVGIAGAPGAGKSTTTALLVHGVNQLAQKPLAIAVPMDGYHFSNEKLQEMGILHLKGIPDSFDASGFVTLLEKLRNNSHSSVPAPLFDRSIEASIDGGIVIEPENKICIVEGNYLLLQTQPWADAKKYFDEIWFLDASIKDVHPRLIARHLAARSAEEARIKMESTDIPNAKLILESKQYADRIIKIEDDLSPAQVGT